MMKKIVSFLWAVLLIIGLVGCGESTSEQHGANDVYAKDGYAVGGLEDVMHTYCFTFTVNSAYVCENYESYVPDEGYDMVVAEVTLKNTGKQAITMCDTDFQIQWGDDEDANAFDVPVTYYVDTTAVLSEEILPYEYELESKESITGHLVFQVPEGRSEYSIAYQEYFSDDTFGDLFFVFFRAEKK